MQRSFAERIENMVNATKLTQIQQEELNNKLINAATNGDIKNVRELIESGANVDAKDDWRFTALHWAAWYGKVDIARVLIENGVHVDATNNDGWTALHWAAWYEYVDVAKVLIENRINVNVKNKNNETAAEIALRWGYHQIAELIENSKKICSNNVDPEKENKIDIKNIDILSMDIDELVRMADESTKRLYRKD